MNELATVNRWARMSCDKWNGEHLPPIFNKAVLRPVKEAVRAATKASRRFYRQLYRNEARRYWQSPFGKERTEQYQDGYYYVNTYPWPYNHPGFADWEEDDATGNYTLVSDQSGFIVRHSTSYCAWKIFEATGQWPQRKTRRRFDARLWREFLAEAGYSNIVIEPWDEHRYIGVEKYSDKQYGEVVWFEMKHDPEKVVVSTYSDKKYFCGFVDPKKYIWIQIM